MASDVGSRNELVESNDDSDDTDDNEIGANDADANDADTNEDGGNDDGNDDSDDDDNEENEDNDNDDCCCCCRCCCCNNCFSDSRMERCNASSNDKFGSWSMSRILDCLLGSLYSDSLFASFLFPLPLPLLLH